MKKNYNFPLLIIVSLSFVFATISCDNVKDEVNEITKFDVSMDLPDHYFELDSTQIGAGKSVLDEQILTESHYTINLDSIFQYYGLSSGLLSNTGFTNLTISLANPLPGVNFDFMNSMRITISETSDFENEVLLASTGAIEAGSTSVSFAIEQANVTDYLNRSDFYLRVYGDLNGPLPVAMLPLLLQSGVSFTVSPL